MVSIVVESVHHVGELIARLDTRERVVMLETRDARSAWQRTFRSCWHRLLLHISVVEFFEVTSHLDRLRSPSKLALLSLFHLSGMIHELAFNLSTVAKFFAAFRNTAIPSFL